MGDKSILVVDDDEQIVLFVKSRLEFEGFKTLEAHDGTRAIQMTKQQHPDLIVLDLQMPCGTGEHVIETLKKDPATASIPIIVMTGMEGEGLEDRIRSMGIQVFFKKPYEPDELVMRIKLLLGM